MPYTPGDATHSEKIVIFTIHDFKSAREIEIYFVLDITSMLYNSFVSITARYKPAATLDCKRAREG